MLVLVLLLVLSFLIYYLVPAKFRNLVLAVSSILVWLWIGPLYLGFVLAVVLLNYFGAMAVENARRRRREKVAAGIVVILDVLLFVAFRYAKELLLLAGIAMDHRRFLLLSLGISFFMLQNISYVLDVCRGEVQAEKNLIQYMTFAMMFPKILTGPLLSYGEFEVQLEKRRITKKKLVDGAERFLFGIAKCLILASSCKEMFDVIWNLPKEQMTVLLAWFGCLAFALFVFYAFSGCCDMAAGLGKLLGFEFPENVNAPWMSVGVMDYWSRWISTLWKWFCSYVYVPLCGSNPAGFRGFLSLVFTWILIGLWHGFRVTFVIWGVLFGILLFLEGFLLRQVIEKIPALIRWFFTMIVVLFSWVFVFCPTLSDVAGYLQLMFGVDGCGFVSAKTGAMIENFGVLLVLCVLFAMPFVGDLCQKLIWKNKNRKAQIIRCVSVFVLILTCVSVQKSIGVFGYSADILLGKRESNEVYLGKDHYLFQKIAKPEEETLNKNIQAISDFASVHYNIPGYFMLVPDKANVESKLLPNIAVVEDQSSQFSSVKEQLGNAVTWVDAETVLKEHESEEIYYRTDDHWTSLGAFYGYEALAESMGLSKEQSPNLKPYVVTNEFNGNLSKESGFERGYKESVSIYSAKKVKDNTSLVMTMEGNNEKSATLYDTEKLKKGDAYGLFPSYECGRTDIETTVDTKERLLLFKDSYANSMLPFLISHFREIVVIDPDHYKGNLGSLMEEKKFTRILYLYSGNEFMTNETLSSVLK